MTKDLADELERLAKALFDEPDAARRIYRSVALSLWVENNLPRIISALRREEPASLTGEAEPIAWPDREAVARKVEELILAGLFDHPHKRVHGAMLSTVHLVAGDIADAVRDIARQALTGKDG